jgi:hypothetical protein
VGVLVKVEFNMASMVRKFNLVLALLPGVIFAQVPADTNLKPCGDTFYYPSKVLYEEINCV